MTQSGFRKVWKILLFFMGHWCVMKLFKMEIIYPGHFLLLILFLSIFGKGFPCFFYVFVRVPCLTSFYFKNDKKKKNKGVESTGRNWKIWLLSDVRPFPAPCVTSNRCGYITRSHAFFQRKATILYHRKLHSLQKSALLLINNYVYVFFH